MHYTLKKRQDFLTAQRDGLKFIAPGFILQQTPLPPHLHSKPGLHFGLTVSKRVGNAVKRNRGKRRLRALIRQNMADNCNIDYYYVFIGRPLLLTRAYPELEADLVRALGWLARQRAKAG